MTKTVSTRIDDKTHQEIIDRCNIEGCTVAHFLNCAIELAITGSTPFDFGERDEGVEYPQSKSTSIGIS